MSVSQPSEGLPVKGKSASTMRLPLHRAGDHNGNAFPVSSSSSSSSCLGESSPESLRSLSSLSGGRTDSPMDYDILEVTLMTTVTTKKDEMTEIVISKWVPEEESKPDDNQDAEVGNVQTGTELTESNDNSVSVYLDANSDEYHQDTWNDNDNHTLALSLTTNSGSRGDNGDLSSGSSNRRRHGSSTPDSDATEIPADDDDDDEEEALFLSVSSDMGVRRRSTTLTSSTEQSGGSLVNPGSSGATELQTEGTAALSVADERPELVLASEDLTESIQISSSSPSCANPTPDTKKVTSPPLEEVERGAVSLKPNTSQSARGAKTKPTTATSSAPRTAVSTPIKASSLEAKRVSKLDLKNVKAKVGSRSTPSPPKTPSQNKCAPAIAKRAAPRKEDAQTGDGGKKQRSPGGPVRVAVVLKPIRGKSSNLKTNHKTAANDSSQLEQKESVSVSRTLSASTSSLGSDVVEEATPDSPRKAVQEETPEGVESSHASEDAHEESVEDQKEGTGKSLMTEAAVEKPRNHSKSALLAARAEPNDN
ncbi:hypothetical protein D9C73_003431 [Collichthys lucidus]|uniref:Uncharacterized protein n=1 Tax=Collichthys lucidus TaxID=240159 RepID=A0A4U5U573_COLLU|nr:hypothetical protein D9C73_003431 [Collichthys lucidus]